MNIRLVAMIASVAFAPALAVSAEPHTEHTYRLEPGEARPQATLRDAQWLVGAWTGTAFGQQFDQTWNPPSAGSMLGHFKLYGDDGASFFELLLLSVEEDTLSLKVKHFNPDFSAWEEKDDYVNFRLVKKDENALHFGGLSFYRRCEDEIDGYIVMKSGGEGGEQYFHYRRR